MHNINLQDTSARLNLKTNQQLKLQIEKAASLMGVSLTDFILTSAKEKSDEVIKTHCNTYLSITSRDRLNEILESPTKEITPAMMAISSKSATPQCGSLEEINIGGGND